MKWSLAIQMGTATLSGPQYAPVGGAPGPEHRFVSIGNPHMVLDVDDLAAYPLETPRERRSQRHLHLGRAAAGIQ
jgi:diaminopimelate epimerase